MIKFHVKIFKSFYIQYKDFLFVETKTCCDFVPVGILICWDFDLQEFWFVGILYLLGFRTCWDFVPVGIITCWDFGVGILTCRDYECWDYEPLPHKEQGRGRQALEDTKVNFFLSIFYNF
jgi:hypothetical protein